MRRTTIAPRFVETIPDRLEDGDLYISERYGTAIHKCCCGCGEEVVTPLTSADWRLHRRGGTVSLSPSIGNWNYACRSHYWIRDNRVLWAGAISEREIAQVKARDKAAIEAYVEATNHRKPESLQNPSWLTWFMQKIRHWLG